MGASPSKEQLLYQQVQKGNHDAVKAYRRDGASLEWVDKEGRTPLILACTRPELLDMAVTLLNLGANITAYRPGIRGGFPLHHAAEKGLEKTVALLLSHGADPFAVNDDGHTPLEMARSRGHVSVVRLLEEHVSIFRGMLREFSGPAVLETLVPNLCTKKIWAVVIPIESPGKRAPKYELAIYTSPKVSIWNGIRPTSHPAGICNVAQPRTVIQLSKAEVCEPKFSSKDPILHITDKTNKTKYKFLSDKEGDKAQLQRFHKACMGIKEVQYGGIPASLSTLALPSPVSLHGNPCQIHPVLPHQGEAPSLTRKADSHHVLAASNASSPCNYTTSATVPMSDDVELALALDASIHSATEEQIPISPASSHANFTSYLRQDDLDRRYRRWGLPEHKNCTRNIKCSLLRETEDMKNDEMYGKAETGTSRLHSPYPSTDTKPDSSQTMSTFTSNNKLKKPVKIQAPSETLVATPSAPPLPHMPADDYGNMNYQNVGILEQMDSVSCGTDKMETEKVNGMCVVCWDARAEGACVPCGHMASCMSCLAEITTKNWGCPVCRAPIQQIIKVYAI